MAYMNCPICGKLFDHRDFYEVCPGCFAQTQADFDKLRDYLYCHSNKSMQEVSSATGVSIEKIRIFLRQGRLISS